jgi:hypothetical protein
MIAAYAFVGFGAASLALGSWMMMHPDRGHTKASYEWRILGDEWKVIPAYGGATTLHFSREHKDADAQPDSMGIKVDYWHEGLELTARPYWAKRIWPRVWYRLDLDWKYVRDVSSFWTAPDGNTWATTISDDITADVTFKSDTNSAGPFPIDHMVDHNGGWIRDKKTIRAVMRFLNESSGPVRFHVVIKAGYHGVVGEREVILPGTNFKYLLEKFPEQAKREAFQALSKAEGNAVSGGPQAPSEQSKGS